MEGSISLRHFTVIPKWDAPDVKTFYHKCFVVWRQMLQKYFVILIAPAIEGLLSFGVQLVVYLSFAILLYLYKFYLCVNK